MVVCCYLPLDLPRRPLPNWPSVVGAAVAVEGSIGSHNTVFAARALRITGIVVEESYSSYSEQFDFAEAYSDHLPVLLHL